MSVVYQMRYKNYQVTGPRFFTDIHIFGIISQLKLSQIKKIEKCEWPEKNRSHFFKILTLLICTLIVRLE